MSKNDRVDVGDQKKCLKGSRNSTEAGFRQEKGIKNFTVRQNSQVRLTLIITLKYMTLVYISLDLEV